jgi:hypothetical protein
VFVSSDDNAVYLAAGLYSCSLELLRLDIETLSLSHAQTVALGSDTDGAFPESIQVLQQQESTAAAAAAAAARDPILYVGLRNGLFVSHVWRLESMQLCDGHVSDRGLKKPVRLVGWGEGEKEKKKKKKKKKRGRERERERERLRGRKVEREKG